ncbi:hypothetical protein FF098_005840 [Parvularcula flava]|uniref:Uncharacterized protein n=1 Tax=Aquisalinus luteolus TaxID=1566827 RepID=A0A8J3A344_9PROT|nr:hypothetical protein [Aquisalinus luteolus]NHK27421.1 hypothetical protein [Aquisalinus luteolus]GGH95390.1 hypothetical protein GCM10011355_11810 [Aquisalinus luteolus]
METLVPVTQHGVIKRPLVTMRLHYMADALVIDLLPRAVYLEKPDLDDLAADNPIHGTLQGAGEVVADDHYLRLTFDFIEALAFSTVEQGAHPAAWETDDEAMPVHEGQDRPYPFVEVRGSSWCKTVPSEPTHFRIVTMNNRLDLLAYEPKSQWMDRP